MGGWKLGIKHGYGIYYFKVSTASFKTSAAAICICLQQFIGSMSIFLLFPPLSSCIQYNKNRAEAKTIIVVIDIICSSLLAEKNHREVCLV